MTLAKLTNRTVKDGKTLIGEEFDSPTPSIPRLDNFGAPIAQQKTGRCNECGKLVRIDGIGKGPYLCYSCRIAR